MEFFHFFCKFFWLKWWLWLIYLRWRAGWRLKANAIGVFQFFGVIFLLCVFFLFQQSKKSSSLTSDDFSFISYHLGQSNQFLMRKIHSASSFSWFKSTWSQLHHLPIATITPTPSPTSSHQSIHSINNNQQFQLPGTTTTDSTTQAHHHYFPSIAFITGSHHNFPLVINFAIVCPKPCLPPDGSPFNNSPPSPPTTSSTNNRCRDNIGPYDQMKSTISPQQWQILALLPTFGKILIVRWHMDWAESRFDTV